MLWDATERLKRQRERNHQGYLDCHKQREDRWRGRGPFATNTREHPYKCHPGDHRSTHVRCQPESSKAAVMGPSHITTDDTLSTTIVTTNDDEDGVYEEYYEEELADESINAEVPTVDEGVA
ncbi:hypothetical protein BKA83DRAFT_4121117 [Pisolithus microcarpus]|nr:hypothetical protein BKA83DRAFT_4121117 [Pisolithus microcarpus]